MHSIRIYTYDGILASGVTRIVDVFNTALAKMFERRYPKVDLRVVIFSHSRRR